MNIREYISSVQVNKTEHKSAWESDSSSSRGHWLKKITLNNL